MTLTFKSGVLDGAVLTGSVLVGFVLAGEPGAIGAFVGSAVFVVSRRLNDDAPAEEVSS